MSRDDADRIETLAARVRWLDQYRRALSLVAGGAVWFLLAYKVAIMFREPGPSMLTVTVGLMFGALSWLVVEAAFAWVIAMFEVEHDRLASEQGLPTAVLLRPRRK